MAYCDYGAFVYKNGERRKDKEDVPLFKPNEGTFKVSNENLIDWIDHIHHGILGDGNIRVLCHKQGLPETYELTEDGIKEISYKTDEMDWWDYGEVEFEYNDYKFRFTSGYDTNNPYVAEMIEPDGTVWKCEYDYGYGEGFEQEDLLPTKEDAIKTLESLKYPFPEYPKDIEVNEAIDMAIEALKGESNG